MIAMLCFAAKTHPGNREGENEDTVGEDLAQNLFLVADGMGGHVAGKTASELAKSAVLEATDRPAVSDKLICAHQAIVAAAKADDKLSGMGSTIVVLQICDSTAEISWVGDSRAYLFRRNHLRQLTRDHSLLETMRERNYLSEAQLRADPRSNVVTQTLGLGDPKPSSISESVHAGDRFLLCSDGLSDELTDEEIRRILAESDDVEAASTSLLQSALDHGGRDNTSVTVIEIEGPIRGSRSRSASTKTTVVAIAVVIAALVIWYLVWPAP